jgi:hypothetical protein
MQKHLLLKKLHQRKIEHDIINNEFINNNYNNEFIDINKSRIGLIYVYYERDNQQKNQTNLSFFIKYGLNKKNWLNLNIKYLFVINNNQCEVIIPKREDVYVLKEDNCHDYEGWYNGIKYFEDLNKTEIYNQFDYLCLMNAGTNGPFMDEDINNHWLLPFYNKMIETDSVACSPYINNLPSTTEIPGMHLSCHFTLLKINKNIINILTNTKFVTPNKLYKNTVIGYKKDKLDAIFTGEYGLSSKLQLFNYKVCCLYYENNIPIQYSDMDREEFYHINNDKLKKTIFIKNIWRYSYDSYDNYTSIPVLYDYCTDYMFQKLNIKNIFYKSNLNYELLKIKNDNDLWTSKENYYNLYGHAEENIIFPMNKINNKSCVIYAHYDTNNIIADYVISSIKALISVGYDIIFYTASQKINNINLDILPFKIIFFENQGVGTDWKIWLHGLSNLKNSSAYDWILLLNDSILMPINGIENFKNTIDTMRINSDFWGHWDSIELRYHIIGALMEFKYNLIEEIIIFISNTLKSCKQDFDYIDKMETSLTQYLINKGYTYNVVIKHDNIISTNIYPCPSHNPYLINQWINNKSSFAIKWKYCISYLNKDVVSSEFNYLTRFLYYGPYGTISKGELCGAFPKSLITISEK